MMTDISPEKFFSNSDAEIATNRFDRDVIKVLLSNLQSLGVKVLVRLENSNYSDTLLVELPTQVTDDIVIALLELNPDECWKEEGKLVLWWD